MLRAFDHHPATGRLVLQCASFAGDTWLRIVDGRGRTVDEIPPHDLPVHARWSPDGSALTYGTNDGRILVHDLATRTSRLVFGDAEYQAGFSEWSPDGRHLAFTAHRRPSERVSDKCPPDVYHCTVATGEVCRLTDAPDASDRFPNWSPDATRIAFHRQDLGEPGTPKRVHLVRVGGGGDHRSVVPLLNRSVGRQRFGRFPWSPDGRWFALHVETDEGCAARVVDERGEDSGWRWEEGAVTETAFSPAEDRLLCALEDGIVWVSWPEGRTLSRLPLNFGIRGSATGRQIAFGARSGEVWFLGGDSRLYRWDGADDCIVVAEHTDDTKPSCRVEEFALRAADGLELYAQRLIPAAPAALAVLYVHGGPGETLDPDDSWALQLVASGYEVVRVAYRGSAGYGGRLKTANTGCYGVCDVRDVIDAGVRWQGSFGRGRPLALFGDSYGGYLSLMALARSDSPFSCAICTCPAINMLTHPLHRDRALPADPERRRHALQDRSVFAAAAHIGRPVLLFQGALDTVATTQQMRELAQQISAAGGPCELVVFEDDTHSLARHRPEVRLRSERFLA